MEFRIICVSIYWVILILECALDAFQYNTKWRFVGRKKTQKLNKPRYKYDMHCNI